MPGGLGFTGGREGQGGLGTAPCARSAAVAAPPAFMKSRRFCTSGWAASVLFMVAPPRRSGFPRGRLSVVGERKMRRSAETVPTIMLACAPRVVNGRQKMESTSAGKLALAAMAKARPTM